MSISSIPIELQQDIIKKAIEYKGCDATGRATYIDFKQAIKIALLSKHHIFQINYLLGEEKDRFEFAKYHRDYETHACSEVYDDGGTGRKCAFHAGYASNGQYDLLLSTVTGLLRYRQDRWDDGTALTYAEICIGAARAAPLANAYINKQKLWDIQDDQNILRRKKEKAQANTRPLYRRRYFLPPSPPSPPQTPSQDIESPMSDEPDVLETVRSRSSEQAEQHQKAIKTLMRKLRRQEARNRSMKRSLDRKVEEQARTNRKLQRWQKALWREIRLLKRAKS